MGAGAKKKHEPNVVAPSAPAAEPSIDSDLELGFAPAAGIVAMEAASSAATAWTSKSYPITAAGFGALVGGFASVKAALEKAQDEGAPAQLVKDAWDDIKPVTKEFLQALPVGELEKLASEKGFPHPGLVGLHPAEDKDHPLVFWLNPYYAGDSPQKQAVWNKALERWETLKNGGTVEGMNLAAYLGAHPNEKDGGASAETLTPEELTELAQELQGLYELCQSAQHKNPSEVDDAFREKVANAKLDFHALRQRYVFAACTDPEFVKPNLPLAVQNQYYPGPTTIGVDELKHIGARLQAEHGLSLLDAEIIQSTGVNGLVSYLYPLQAEAKELADAGFKKQKAALLDLATHVPHIAGPLAPLVATWHPYEAKALALADLPTTADYPTAEQSQQGVVDFITHYDDAQKALSGLKDPGYYTTNSLFAGPAVAALLLPGGDPAEAKKLGHLKSYKVKQKLPASFRLWAKGQKLPALRSLAVALAASGGGDPPDLDAAKAAKLNRAQIQNYLVGFFDPDSKAKYEQSVTAGPKEKKPKTYSHPGPATVQTAPQKADAGIMVPADASFARKRSAMAAGLQHLAAALAVIPDRPTKAEVATLKLTDTAAPVSGGIHPKKFFSDGKGRTWMFKTAGAEAGAARAAAEEAASEIFRRVGLPSVPVYRHALHGHEGSIQPIVAHSGTVNPQPQSWSQADIDAMVRYHVASWVVGDHDGNSKNMLRTPGGGIVAIDQGQAWKFVGRDKLNVDYQPNSSFGSQPPVYHRAYKAAQSGELAPGVTIRPEAAHPIIERFEQMSDDEFRQIIEPAAKLGAKSRLTWFGPMSKRAEQRCETTTPTEDQVAEAFVENVVARKKNLRKDFAKFFSSLGFAGAHHLEAVA